MKTKLNEPIKLWLKVVMPCIFLIHLSCGYFIAPSQWLPDIRLKGTWICFDFDNNGLEYIGTPENLTISDSSYISTTIRSYTSNGSLVTRTEGLWFTYNDSLEFIPIYVKKDYLDSNSQLIDTDNGKFIKTNRGELRIRFTGYRFRITNDTLLLYQGYFNNDTIIGNWISYAKN